jgi:hypothetical protein
LIRRRNCWQSSGGCSARSVSSSRKRGPHTLHTSRTSGTRCRWRHRYTSRRQFGGSASSGGKSIAAPDRDLQAARTVTWVLHQPLGRGAPVPRTAAGGCGSLRGAAAGKIVGVRQQPPASGSARAPQRVCQSHSPPTMIPQGCWGAGVHLHCSSIPHSTLLLSARTNRVAGGQQDAGPPARNSLLARRGLPSRASQPSCRHAGQC